MVRKLIKHELIALFRIVYIPAIAAVALAVLLRISIAINGGSGETTVPWMIITLSMSYVCALSATSLVCFFMSVSRFYKSLFSGEGYMTLSLPVTASQLIWAKLLSALVVMLFGAVACILSALVFFIGLPADFYASLGEFFGGLWEAISFAMQQEPLAVFELVLLGIVSVPAGILLCYLIISVAQMFTVKSRKGIMVLFFFGGIFLLNILSSALLTPLIELTVNVSPHLVLWIFIVLISAVDVGSFFAVRYILTNKVNMIS